MCLKAQATSFSCPVSLAGPWDDEEDDLDPFVDDPNDLLGKDIEFEVKISNVTLDQKLLGVNGVPKFDHCFVRYKFDPDDDDEKSWSKTKELSTGMDIDVILVVIVSLAASAKLQAFG